MTTDLLRLMRPHYSLTLSAGLLVIGLYVTGGRPQWAPWLTAVAALACVLAGSYIMNDLCDTAIDRINAPRRPLAAGRINRKTAQSLAIALIAAGLLIAAFVTSAFMIVLTAVTAGLAQYNRYSKRLGSLKNVAAALLACSLYPLAFAMAEPIPGPRLKALAIFPIWLFLTALSYEMFKDIPDMAGDGLVTHPIFPNYSEKPWFAPAARTILIKASAIALLPWALRFCGWIYLLLVLAALAAAVIAVRQKPIIAIRLIYLHVVLITLGSLLDLLLLGPEPHT